MLNARRYAQLKQYGLFIAVAVLGSAWVYWTRVPSETVNAPGQAAHINFLAPSFSLDTLDGKTVSLEDMRGRVVLINFWATWCLPCRSEMPAIQAAFEAHGTEEFVVLAVNMGEDEQTVQSFVDEFHLTFPILLDRDGQVINQYNVRALPTSLFVDRAGIIRATGLGGMNRASIEAEISKLLEPSR